MSNELIIHEQKCGAIVTPEARYQLDEIKKVYAPNATDAEFNQYVMLAETMQLNPVRREIYFIKYGNQPQYVTGYQVYLQRAAQSGLLNGWNVKEEWKNGQLFACVITIYRKDQDFPLEWKVYRSEWDKNSGLWKSSPVFMLTKVAIGQGMRLAFPDLLSGYPYLAEEINPDGAPGVSPTPVSQSEAPKRRKRQVQKQEEKVIDAEVVEEEDEYGEGLVTPTEQNGNGATHEKAPEPEEAPEPEKAPEPKQPPRPDNVKPQHVIAGEPLPEANQEQMAAAFRKNFGLSREDLETILGSPYGAWTEDMRLFLKKGWSDVKSKVANMEDFVNLRYKPNEEDAEDF